MRFVVLGDLHYSIYSSPLHCAWREEFFERLFTSVRKLEAEAVFAIGDTTDNGLAEEFEGLHALARRCDLRFITVNGNHDALKMDKATLRSYTGNRKDYYSLYFEAENNINSFASEKKSPFLIMDTAKERNHKDHGGFVDAGQLNWLAGEIGASEGLPLFAFGHHPVKGATRWSSFPMLNIDNSREVAKVFKSKQNGPAFYFCGHNHTNSINRQGNWHFIQTASPLRTADFRLVEWSPEKIELHTVPVEGGKTALKLALKLAEAMGDFLSVPARGFPWDRAFRISLQQPEYASLKQSDLQVEY
ncbi:MAG TPA: metallophosphoesterase [Chloroflexia bacterium]|nr:metallophosphoesterase [Chloroflexia bacterium]